MTKRDYYEILGIDKSADEKEIKKAYRKFAIKYHPDKLANASEKEKKEAEEKFKEINEAYQVLSNPEQRQKYDQFGHSAFANGGFDFNSSGFGGFEDIFGDIFGSFSSSFGGGFSGFSSKRSYVEPGDDLRYTLEITLEEAAFGVEKKIKYNRKGKCSKCNGTGAEDEAMQECTRCNGTGHIVTKQKTILGVMQTQSVCPECNGKGKIPKKICKHCHGSGIEKEKVERTVKIPAGIDNGQKLRLQGMGEASPTGGPNGDLYVVIKIKPHDIFTRREFDLICEVPISYATAVLGGEVEIPTLKGKKKINIPQGTESGKIFRVSKEGIQHLRGNYRGDILVNITIETPKHLNEKQKELLKKFEDSLEDKNYKKKTSFLEKIKKIFE